MAQPLRWPVPQTCVCAMSVYPLPFNRYTPNRFELPSDRRETDPNAYASHAEAKENPAKFAFNCAQRAHANFLEHQSQMIIPLLIGGLRYPVLSAGLGLAWCIARVMYTLGYVKGKTPAGRAAGNWFWLAEFGLQGTAVWTSWQLLSG